MPAIRVWLKSGICVLLFVWGVMTPIILFMLVTNRYDLDSKNSVATVNEFEGGFHHDRKPLDYPVQVNKEDLQYQVEELQQIAVSVRNELRDLEQHKTEVRKELETNRDTLNRVRVELVNTKSDLQESKVKLARTLREMKRVGQYENQALATKAPVVIINLPREENRQNHPELESNKQDSPVEVPSAFFDENCIDLSKCPLMQPFGIYVYNQHHPNLFALKYPTVVDDLLSSLEEKHSLVNDPNHACVFVVIVGPLKEDRELNSGPSLREKLVALPNWGDGRNHLVIDLVYYNETLSAHLERAALGNSIRVKGYTSIKEAKRCNLLLPPVTKFGKSNEQSWKGLPPFLPAIRQILLYFEGSISSEAHEAKSSQGWINPRLLKSFREAVATNSVDRVNIDVKCSGAKGDQSMNHYGEWLLCGTLQQRALNLSQSTFSLVIGSHSGSTGPITFTRLVEALRYGAIPVILGIKSLPFSDVIDWKAAAVILPSSSLGELHYILKNIENDSVLRYRRQGRFLWETYFSSSSCIMDTIVAIIRQKTLHPPPAALDFEAKTTLVNVPGENRVLNSPRFQYNFTTYSDRFWNSPPGPFYMYPLTPFKPAPVSGSQYVNLDKKRLEFLPHHIISAGGITGPYFEDYLLGNVPEEQFTILMLTFERDKVLVEALERLKDLDHLAKVVVVWNNPNRPAEDMKWPNIGAPIDVVSVGRNSLNNRFLPFSNIHTEAILSIDDDVHLRHDEIQFAFRVWREARDRVVGFPGRFHAWDTRHNGWLYNSNYTCELSMVLTGAAFIHKYYMYLYSHWLYQEARELVDQYINCEDIAMNFLVSHITRKPPLKVTSRWTFRCPGCPETLSNSDEHFNERHVCINKLVEMFGYMPLLYTQFRIDSVLFKTRLPSHLEKCYEFI